MVLMRALTEIPLILHDSAFAKLTRPQDPFFIKYLLTHHRARAPGGSFYVGNNTFHPSLLKTLSCLVVKKAAYLWLWEGQGKWRDLQWLSIFTSEKAFLKPPAGPSQASRDQESPSPDTPMPGEGNFTSKQTQVWKAATRKQRIQIQTSIMGTQGPHCPLEATLPAMEQFLPLPPKFCPAFQ